MISLSTLKNSSREYKSRKRVGRGIGSKSGKTCGRGEKGAGSRSGYKRRYGKEGGNMPLFMKTPIRGFSNAPFRIEFDVVNLGQIDAVYNDGEVVNKASLVERGFITNSSRRIKLLGKGSLTKKVSIEVEALSESAREKLASAKIPVKLVE